MRDLGEIKEYLGITVDSESRKYGMKFHQNKYIESLVGKYKLENCKFYNTPM